MPSFLIVRLGALGDVVHAIPVAAALRRAHPQARIDWLVNAKHAAILDLVPVLNDRIVVDSALKTLSTLRRHRYDTAIDLQGLIKSASFARLSGARRVVGFAREYLREPLARMAYTDTWDPGRGGMFDPRETRHVVEINLGLLDAIGLRAGPPEFPLGPVTSDAAKIIRQTVGARYALINPGAAWPNKRWPPERFGALARAISARHALPSVVLWGPDERQLGDAVVAHASGTATLSPPTTVHDLVAITREATVMVSGDTGPMHIAAAVGTALVGLYGPTRPERNGPWGPRNTSVSRASACECHHLRQCRRASMCLLDITVDEVMAAVDARLSGAARG